MDTLGKLKYLKNGKNIYLIYGDEKYLVKEAFDEIVNNVVAREDRTMNLDYFTGKEVNPDSIIDALNTLTFFSTNRCVVVRDTGLLKKSANVDNLIKALEDVPESTYLVFVEEVDKTSKLYKAIVKQGVVYDMKTPKETDLVSFVENLAKAKNVKIDRGTTVHFLRTVENDMVVINNEIEKLAAYCLNKSKIDKNDIDLVCTKSLQVEIFKLMDAIGNKQIQQALEIYNNMIFMKEPVLRILSMLARQVKLILLSKELSEQGYNMNDISAKIGVHSFVAKGCISQSKNFSKKTLYDTLLALSDLEVKIKTGKMKDVIGLETLIVSMF